MRYDVSDLEWSVIEPDGPFRERCPRYNNLSTVIGRSHPMEHPDIPAFYGRRTITMPATSPLTSWPASAASNHFLHSKALRAQQR